MRLAVLAVVCLALAACAPVAVVEPAPPAAPIVPPPDQTAGIDVNATAACVRENATEGELALMALGDERAQAATAQVLQKPATIACLNRAGVQLPGLPAS